MVYMELRLFSQFVAVNKMYAVFIIFQRSKYIINNVRLIPGTYYLTAIIIEYAPG
ncbi:hypothetical protein SEEN978_03541 [Salmonella enterica subsp. enterica serovar Newport str. CVM 37978]|nr:hypothetical protein SEEN978_03541 [Salmonella enterica subsp. enterica serovar Newport str. CVM 37978]